MGQKSKDDGLKKERWGKKKTRCGNSIMKTRREMQ